MTDPIRNYIETPGGGYVGWYQNERRQDWTTPRAMFDRLQAEYGEVTHRREA